MIFDNSTAVFFSKNNESRSRCKYIDIKYLSVRENIKRHEVFIRHINTKSIIVDLVSKILLVKKYKVTWSI